MCLIPPSKPSNSNRSKSKHPKPPRIQDPFSTNFTATYSPPAFSMPKSGYEYQHSTAPLPPMIQTRSSRKFYPQNSKQGYSLQEEQYIILPPTTYLSPTPALSHQERKIARRSSLLDDIDFFHAIQAKLSSPKQDDDKGKKEKEDKEKEDMRAELVTFRKEKEKGEWKSEIASLRRDLEERERERALGGAVANARKEGAAAAREKEAEKRQELERRRERERDGLILYGGGYGVAAGVNAGLGLPGLGSASPGSLPRITNDSNINWQFCANSNANMPQINHSFGGDEFAQPNREDLGVYGRGYYRNGRRGRDDWESSLAAAAGHGEMRIINQRLSRMEGNQAANQAVLDAIEREMRYERTTRRSRYFD